MLPVLRSLAEDFGVTIRAIGAGQAAARDHFPGLQLVEWSEASEISEVQEMDIGIMPVGDGAFERGKCGYKLIQYMACGLPVVASPVGVNQQIVDHDGNGYLVQSPEEWRKVLVRLIENPQLRFALGRGGRERIVADYSLAVHAPRLVELFRSVLAGPTL
jgi:glycosyltransferase involved in cell wall biosynthesis